MAQTKKVASPKAVAKPGQKPLPVTLLSGFLGAGKTTLLQHILRTEHGLRIAVIVNDIGAINVDASIIKQTHQIKQTNDKVIALQNGCICCTLRGDLLEELIRLSELSEFDYIIVESSGISEPEQVAETFDTQLIQQMGAMLAADGENLDEGLLKAIEKIKKAGGLDKYARLDTTVTVIDAFTILNDFDTDEFLSDRRRDVEDEDRTVSDLMVDQIEFADVIILNKIDMVSPDAKPGILNMIKKLNHRAKILEATRGKIDVAEIVNTGKFSLEAAKVGYGWLQDLHEMTLRLVNGKNVVAPKPETEEYNVGNFVWRRERPLHPLRFFKFIYDKYVLQLEHEEDEEDEDDEDAEMDEGEDEEEEEDDEDEDDKMDATSPDSAYASMADIETLPNDVVMANRRKHPVLARLFRSKGEFFLASRPGRAGEWSQAGAIMRLEGGRPWFCTMSLEDFKNNDGEIDAMVQFDLKSGGEWGDRRQEIVFIGENLDVAALETLLDECLLDDDEFKQWEQVMRDQSMTDEQKAETLAKIFEDGFPEWPEAHDHDHDHDHENEEEGHDHGKRGVRKISDYVEEMEEVS